MDFVFTRAAHHVVCSAGENKINNVYEREVSCYKQATPLGFRDNLCVGTFTTHAGAR